MNIKVSRFRSLTFFKKDGTQISTSIPRNLDQTLIRRINFDNYIIRIVAVSRDIAESEFASFQDGNGKFIGCLIPGSGILSTQNPNNSNPVFAAYSLIVAASVCLSSFSDEFDLADTNCQDATHMDNVFASKFFYAIFEKSKLSVDNHNFDRNYFACLYANGLVLSKNKRHPLLSLSHDAYTGGIKIKSNNEHPEYIREIITNLIPYAENPFLRFFYLYQVVEYLMAEGFQRRYVEVKSKIDGEVNISVTTLRDFLKKLDSSTKEGPRINEVLKPPCPSTSMVAEQILDSLSVDRVDFSFADLIYKIRNIVFHDFPKIHLHGKEIGELSENLLRYIVEKKIL